MASTRAEVVEASDRRGSAATCEFCQELRDATLSRFGRIYGSACSSRIVASRNGLVAMPTLGQLFKGSLLILPEAHFETMAELPDEMQRPLSQLIDYLSEALASLGRVVLFEHGAKCRTGAGCGIYHAHLHMVPLPGPALCDDILPAASCKAASLSEAYQRLHESTHYLLLRDTDGSIAFDEVNGSAAQEYPSQHLRRVLARHFALKRPWDWRAYGFEEKWLLDTLAWFGSQDVPLGTRNTG